MKIALVAEKSIPILTASEGITTHDLQVLRAGVIKLFKSGKNKIILELPNLDSLPGEVIRELSTFDLLARELSGRLVIAGVNAALKTKIEVFAKPPIVLTFESREKALEFLTAPPTPEVPPTTAASTTAAPSAPGAVAPPVATGEADELRAEQSSMKQRLHDLELENKLLKEQIILATIARRPPNDEVAYVEKIQTLEAKIEKLLTEVPVAPAAPAAAAPAAAKK